MQKKWKEESGASYSVEHEMAHFFFQRSTFLCHSLWQIEMIHALKTWCTSKWEKEHILACVCMRAITVFWWKELWFFFLLYSSSLSYFSVPKVCECVSAVSFFSMLYLLLFFHVSFVFCFRPIDGKDMFGLRVLLRLEMNDLVDDQHQLILDATQTHMHMSRQSRLFTKTQYKCSH